MDPASKIKAEALEALDHFDRANLRQAAITQLDKDLEQLEASIAAGASIIDRLKDQLKNL